MDAYVARHQRLAALRERLWSILPRGAILLSALTLASYVMGLLRDRVFARTFGAGSELDVYTAALVLPELVLAILVVAGLSSAFVPVYARLQHDAATATEAFARTVLTASVLLMAVTVGVLFVLAPLTVSFIAPGFDEAQQALAKGIVLNRPKEPQENLPFGLTEHIPLSVAVGAGSGNEHPQIVPKGLEGFGSEFRDQIPSAIGGVQRNDIGVAAQTPAHGVTMVTLDLDAHHGADAMRLGPGAQANRIPDDRAFGFQPGDPVLHGRASHTQFLGDGDHRLTSVVAQECYQLPVCIVHFEHYVIRSWRNVSFNERIVNLHASVWHVLTEQFPGRL